MLIVALPIVLDASEGILFLEVSLANGVADESCWCGTSCSSELLFVQAIITTGIRPTNNSFTRRLMVMVSIICVLVSMCLVSIFYIILGSLCHIHCKVYSMNFSFCFKL